MTYIITSESITLIWEGRSIVVKKGSPNYPGLKAALQNNNLEDIPKYITIPKSIESWSNDKFTIENNIVSYMKDPLPVDVSKRILEMAGNGEDPDPLFKFWERLQRNPSFRSVKQLYNFLQHKNIPITPDGCFLAYKAVRNDYKDIHSGTFDNHPGVTNEMPRNQISDDPNVACHDGFHVGALAYAKSFKGGNDILVICKIDPENVVCVPYDHSQQKMRVCKYKVVGNYGTDLPSTVFDEPLPHDEDLDNEDNIEEENDTEDDDQDSFPSTGRTSYEHVPPPPRITRSSGRKPMVSKSTRALIRKLSKLQLADLLERTIEELRQYATYGVNIVGASKIPGGKVALVRQILKSR